LNRIIHVCRTKSDLIMAFMQLDK